MHKDIILIPTKIEAELVSITKGIIISGIAKRTVSTLKGIHEQNHISKAVLLGFAGRLDDKLTMSSSYNITRVTNGQQTFALSALNKEWPEASSVTVKKPVCNNQKKLELSRTASLVNMEDFYFAEYCSYNQITPYIIRIISDDCDCKVNTFFIPGAFKEAKNELAKVLLTIAPQLSL